jgi:hypothetical protein
MAGARSATCVTAYDPFPHPALQRAPVFVGGARGRRCFAMSRYHCQRCLKHLHGTTVKNGNSFCYGCRDSLKKQAEYAQKKLGRFVGEIVAESVMRNV